jgi:hypothetical protein
MLKRGAAWRALEAHCAALRNVHLRELFAADPRSGERLALEAAGLYLDYSKNRGVAQPARPPPRPAGRQRDRAGRGARRAGSTNALIRRYRCARRK